MPLKKMDFKSMDAAKSDEPTGTPRMKKKKISSKFDQPKDESPAPTPKLKKKKIVQTIVTTDNEPKPGEPLATKPKEELKIHPIKAEKEEPKEEEKPEEPVAPPTPPRAPTPDPEEEPKEVCDGEIDEWINPEDRDPDGKWVIVKKPARISTSEGEDASIKIVVAKGDPLHLPRVQWIKGKWNEITGGTRYGIVVDELTNSHTLTFKSAKMTDSGIYTVKVTSGGLIDSKTFDLKVGPEKGANPGIVIVRGKLPKDVQDEDADFRGKLRKVQKLERLDKDNEGVKGDIWTKLRDTNPREYEKFAFKNGIKDHRAMLKRLTGVKKMNKKSPAFEIRLPDTDAYHNGDRMVLETEVANEAVVVKWLRNGVDMANNKHAKIEQRGRIRRLIVESINQQDDGRFECRTTEDKTCCEVFVHEPPVTLIKGFEDIQLVEGEGAHFFARLSNDQGQYKLLKDGIELTPSDRHLISRDGANVTFEIKNTKRDDAGFYEIQTNGDKLFGELMVDAKPVVFKSGFSDLTVNFNDQAEFLCEVADAEATGKWFFNGAELAEKERISFADEGGVRKLIIKDISTRDQGEYQYVVDGKDGKQPTSLTATLKAYSVTVQKEKVAPKICLNVSEKKEIVIKAGHKFTLDVPITGDPAPQVIWRRGEEDLVAEKTKSGEFNSPLDRPFDKPFGAPTNAKQRCTITNSAGRTRLHLPAVHKTDSGIYTLSLVSEAGEDIMDVSIKVIHKPAAPGIPIISELNNECCRVDWTPPMNDGGCQIDGYVLERKKVNSERWIRLNAKLNTFHNYLARRMVEGNTYQIRVTAINDCGTGDPSPLSETFTPMAPTSEIPTIRKGLTSDTSIELKWDAPIDQGPLGMTGYHVQFQVLKNPDSENPLMDVEEDEWHDWSRTKLKPDLTNQVLDGLETGKTYMFRMAAENAAGKSKWTTVGPIVCAEAVEDPRIIVPRAIARFVKVKVGEKVHFQIPYLGKPKPLITWHFIPMIPVEGEPIPEDAEEIPLEKHVTVKNNASQSVLYIRQGDRQDTGCYVMRVQVGDKVAKATIKLAMVQEPTKPQKIKIVEVIGSSVQLSWEPPKDDGNTEIIGYAVEKRDKRSQEDGFWYIVHERIRHCKCSIDDLIVGNEFQFRVTAFNECGLGDGIFTKDFAVIEKDVLVYLKPVYPEKNIADAPQFTMGLNNRKLTVGYTGTLTASVRGVPKPSIRWFKNKVEIIDNPKYKTSAGMGVCQLEIRRPRLADAGVYTCLATNPSGEATCESTVIVREAK